MTKETGYLSRHMAARNFIMMSELEDLAASWKTNPDNQEYTTSIKQLPLTADIDEGAKRRARNIHTSTSGQLLSDSVGENVHALQSVEDSPARCYGSCRRQRGNRFCNSNVDAEWDPAYRQATSVAARVRQ